MFFCNELKEAQSRDSNMNESVMVLLIGVGELDNVLMGYKSVCIWSYGITALIGKGLRRIRIYRCIFPLYTLQCCYFIQVFHFRSVFSRCGGGWYSIW